MQISHNWFSKAGLAWLFIISILFLLPGSAFPKDNWLKDIHFDKWVHFAFFAVLVFLNRFSFYKSRQPNYFLLSVAFIYAVLVEVVQHHFVSNRSFDLWDIVADMAGAVAGIWFWMKYVQKNRPL